MILEQWENDPEFKILPISEKKRILSNFFDSNTGTDSEFISLPEQERVSIKNKFLSSEMPSITNKVGTLAKQTYQSIGLGAGDVLTGIAASIENAPVMPPPYMTLSEVEALKKRSPEIVESVKRGDRIGKNIASEKLYGLAKNYPEIKEEIPFGLVGQAVTGIARSSAPMVATAFNPPAGVTTTIASIKGNKYNQYIKEGKDEKTANDAADLSALLTAPVEFAGNIIPIKSLTKLVQKSKVGATVGEYITEVLKSAVGEGIEELTQTQLDVIADQYANNPDADPVELGKNVAKQVLTKEHAQKSLESALVGTIGGGGLTGVMGASAMIPGQKPTQAPPTITQKPDNAQDILNTIKEDYDAGNLTPEIIAAIKQQLPGLAADIDKMTTTPDDIIELRDRILEKEQEVGRKLTDDEIIELQKPINPAEVSAKAFEPRLNELDRATQINQSPIGKEGLKQNLLRQSDIPSETMMPQTTFQSETAIPKDERLFPKGEDAKYYTGSELKQIAKDNGLEIPADIRTRNKMIDFIKQGIIEKANIQSEPVQPKIEPIKVQRSSQEAGENTMYEIMEGPQKGSSLSRGALTQEPTKYAVDESLMPSVAAKANVNINDAMAKELEKAQAIKNRDKGRPNDNRISNNYEIDTEDAGILNVQVIRNADGSAVIFNDKGTSEYNAAFANGKSDEALLKYQFEPLGYNGSKIQGNLQNKSTPEEKAKPPLPTELTTEQGQELGFNPLQMLMENQEPAKGKQPQIGNREIDNLIKGIDVEINDWKSRKYKDNKKQVSAGGTFDDLNADSISINKANENRRQRNIQSLERAKQEIINAKNRIDNGESPEKVYGGLLDSTYTKVSEFAEKQLRTTEQGTEKPVLAEEQKPFVKSKKPRLAESEESLWKIITEKTDRGVVHKDTNKILYPIVRIIGEGDFRISSKGIEKVANDGMTVQDATKKEIAEVEAALKTDTAKVVLKSHWGGSGRGTGSIDQEVLHNPSGNSFKSIKDVKPVTEPAKEGKPKEATEIRDVNKIAHTDKSVRDYPQRASYHTGVIRVENKSGNKRLGVFNVSMEEWDEAQKGPSANPNYNKRELVKKKHLKAFPGNVENGVLTPIAERVIDAQVRAIDNVYKSAKEQTTPDLQPAPAEKGEGKRKEGESTQDWLNRLTGQDKLSKEEIKIANLKRQADKIAKEAHDMLERIPAGQPIHSTRDRNLRERSGEKMRKASELYKQAEELESQSQPKQAEEKPAGETQKIEDFGEKGEGKEEETKESYTKRILEKDKEIQEFIKSIEDEKIKPENKTIKKALNKIDDNGDSTIAMEDAEAMVYGDYGIIKEPAVKGNEYNITHVKTGMNIGVVDKLKTAQNIAKAFNKYVKVNTKEDIEKYPKAGFLYRVFTDNGDVPDFVKQPKQAEEKPADQDTTPKTKPGKVFLEKGGVKPFFEYKEIKRGNVLNKGKYRVTLTNGKTVIVNKEAIREFPQEDTGGKPVFLKEGDISIESPTGKTLLSKHGVENIIKGVKTKLPNIGNFEVVKTQDELPEFLFKEQERDNSRIYGVYDPQSDTFYLVADNMKNRDAVLNTVIHEAIGHRGVDAVLPKSRRKQLFRMVNFEYGKKDIGKKIIKDYKLDLTDETDQVTFAREVIAHMAVNEPKASLLDRVISLIKSALRELGITLKISDAEIRSLLTRSYKFAQMGKGKAGSEGLSYSKDAPDITDTKEFKDFFGESMVTVDGKAGSEPLVVYHGTPEGDIEIFDRSKLRRGTGFHFTHSKKVAADYGNSIMPVYLSLVNPLKLETKKGEAEWDRAKHIAKNKGITIVDALKSMGYDGILKGSSPMRGAEIEVFDSEQIKSIFNKGTFDKTDKRIMFSKESKLSPEDYAKNLIARAGKKQPVEKKVVEKVKEPAKTKEPKTSNFGMSGMLSNNDKAKQALNKFADKAGYWILDKNLPIAKIQENLKKMTEELDLFLSETQRPKRTAAKIKQMWENMVTPLLKTMGENQIDLGTLEEYKHAKHARERNEAMRKGNAKRYIEKVIAAAPKETKSLQEEIKDLLWPEEWYSKIDSVFDEFRKIEAVKDIEKQWITFQEKPSGMSDNDADETLSFYQKDKAKLAKIEEVGKIVDAINRETIETLYNSGQIADKEYEIYKTQYKNYVPLHREGFEDESQGTGRGLQPAGRLIKTAMGSTRDVVNILAHSITNLENAINRAEKAESAKILLDMVKANPDPDLWTLNKVKETPRHDEAGNLKMYPDSFSVAPNEMRFMVDGQQYLLSMNRNNDNAMMMLKTLKAEDSMGGPLVNALSKMNKWLARINTTWSPEFVITNFIKDIQAAGININDTGVESKRMFRGALSAIKSIHEVESGKGDGGEYGKYYARFKDAGGKIGWSDIYGTAEKISKELSKDIEMFSGKRPIRQVWNKTFKFIEDWNTSVENGVRLHAFKLAVDQGFSDKKAAQIASDLTVDFTKKGAAGPVINSLYLFANAGIQGSYRIFRAGAKSPKVRKIMGGIVGAGILNGLLNAAIGGQDDDGEDYYNKIDDYVKERNWIIMIPNSKGKYIKIPLPWGYNVLWNIGDEISKTVTKEDYKPLHGAGRLLSVFAQAFNPIQSGTLLQTLSPTITDPFAMVAENKNWYGGDLMPQKNVFEKVPTPDSQRYWKTSRGASQWVAEKLNDWTGGNQVRKGGIDVSPETLDLIVDTMGGSAMRFFTDAAATPLKLIRGEETKVQDFPFIRRAVGEKSQYADQRTYYENLTQVLTAKEELDAYKGTSYYNSLDQELKDMRCMIPFAENSERRLRKLRKIRNRSENKAQIDTLNKQIEQIYVDFNKKYYRIAQ